MPQSEALDRTPTKNLRQESHVISVKENTPIARQWSEGRIDLLENYCQAVDESLETNEKAAELSEQLMDAFSLLTHDTLRH